MSKFTKKLIFAHNGFEAIAKVEQHPDIDIVLMDIKMPKMDGVQATKEIKQIRNCLPIIAQTAYSMFGDKEKMIESGFDDYITKPINRMELLRKIKLLKHRD